MAATKRDEIVIDVAAPKNRNVAFLPTGSVLRSELRSENISGAANIPPYLMKIGGVLPGHRIIVDCAGKKAKIVDRMESDERGVKEIDEKVRTAINDARIRESGGQYKFGSYSKTAEESFTLGDNPPHNLATWLYWIRRGVDTKRFRVVSGVLPEIEEIRKMGVIYLCSQEGVPLKDGARPFNYLYPEEPKAAVAAGA